MSGLFIFTAVWGTPACAVSATSGLPCGARADWGTFMNSLYAIHYDPVTNIDTGPDHDIRADGLP
jgi:hypothetical protein